MSAEIGYIVSLADFKSNKSKSVELGLLTTEQFDKWIKPENMIDPKININNKKH